MSSLFDLVRIFSPGSLSRLWKASPQDTGVFVVGYNQNTPSKLVKFNLAESDYLTVENEAEWLGLKLKNLPATRLVKVNTGGDFLSDGDIVQAIRTSDLSNPSNWSLCTPVGTLGALSASFDAYNKGFALSVYDSAKPIVLDLVNNRIRFPRCVVMRNGMTWADVNPAAAPYSDTDGYFDVTITSSTSVNDAIYYKHSDFTDGLGVIPFKVASGASQPTPSDDIIYLGNYMDGVWYTWIPHVIERNSQWRDGAVENIFENGEFDPAKTPVQKYTGYSTTIDITPVALVHTYLNSIGYNYGWNVNGVASAYPKAEVPNVSKNEYICYEFIAYSPTGTFPSPSCYFWDGATLLGNPTWNITYETIDTNVRRYRYYIKNPYATVTHIYIGFGSALAYDYWITGIKLGVSASPIETIGGHQGTELRVNGLSRRISENETSVADHESRLDTLETSAIYESLPESDCKILLPDNLFVVTDRPLQLFGQNCILKRNKGIIYDFNLWSLNGEIPWSHFFSRDCTLESAKLGSTARFGIINRNDYSKRWYKDVKIYKPAATTSASVKIACIGDSLTNREVIARLKTRLETAGATVTDIGTMSNNGAYGEGREGWEFSNFYGADNTYGASAIVPSSDNPSSLTKNPFLKVADASDLSNHPTWCFGNTGSGTEQSYAENSGLGTYYIFDYANYLSVQGFATPDLVTIALGRNDIWQESPATSLAQVILGLDIMVNQIRAACPSAQIGIINEITGWSSAANADWDSDAAIVIQKKLELYDGDGSNGVWVVPVWAHQSGEVIFPYSATTTDTATGTKTGTVSEYVHWDDIGEHQYAEATFAWAMTMVEEMSL